MLIRFDSEFDGTIASAGIVMLCKMAEKIISGYKQGGVLNCGVGFIKGIVQGLTLALFSLPAHLLLSKCVNYFSPARYYSTSEEFFHLLDNYSRYSEQKIGESLQKRGFFSTVFSSRNPLLYDVVAISTMGIFASQIYPKGP